MAFGWSRTKVSPIAIDFGSEWLKLLQIVPGNPPQLVAAAAARIPESIRRDFPQRQRFLAEALPKALKSQPFKGRRAICSLPAYQTLAQNFEIPRAGAQDIPALVADQLRQRFNVDAARMVIRHYDVGQVTREGSALQHVLCLAASREVVMNYIDLCSQCKLEVVGMHSEPVAVLQAFSHLATAQDDRKGDGEHAICYIDLGSSTTKLTITHGSTIVFAKTIHADASRLAPCLNESPSVAAGAKQQQTLAVETEAKASENRDRATGGSGVAMLDAAVARAGGNGHAGGEGDDGAVNGEESQTALNSADDTLECLIDELQMCLRYHQGLFPQCPMERMVFFGGAARNVQMCQRIAQTVRVAAQLGDPIARLARIGAKKPPTNVDFDQPQPGWTVAFGLTCSEANL